MFDHINTANSGRAALLLMADAAGPLTPEARAKATSATLTEAAGLPGMCEATITAGDLLIGLLVIWSHYAAAHPTLPAEVAAPRKARAKTLREIGEHLCGSPGCPPPSEDWRMAIARCCRVWAIVEREFPGDDARAVAIRETWGREAAYLTKNWGEDATREVRRAQRQRDEEQAARLKAEAREQLMRLALDGAIADLEVVDPEAAAPHKAKLAELYAR